MTTTTRLGALSGDYVLDTANTRIGFAVPLAMVATVRGRFDEFEGTAHLDGDDLSRSSAQLTIKATSIGTRNDRRDDHLRGSFLDVPNHPTFTFTLTDIAKINDTDVTVTGDLTIRGVTRPITMDFALTAVESDPRGELRIGFAGSVTINRKDWGVRWNAALEGGGVLVGEKVTLELDIAAIRQS